MHTKQSSRGFTIIELLTVFTVIAVLVAIVVFAFTRIRSDARDTRAIGEMDQLRKAAFAEANDRGGSFDGIDCSTPALAPLCTSISGMTGNAPVPQNSADGQNWCADVDLSRNTTYCVDSALSATEGFVCDRVNFTCISPP